MKVSKALDILMSPKVLAKVGEVVDKESEKLNLWRGKERERVKEAGKESSKTSE